jgi:hypothetical protein
VALIDLTHEERVALVELLAARTLSPVQHRALDRMVNPNPADDHFPMAWCEAVANKLGDLKSVIVDDPACVNVDRLIAASVAVVEAMHLTCPGCNEAGGAGRVQHEPPLCPRIPPIAGPQVPK